MKQNELMIGDWVDIQEDGKHLKYTKVHSLTCAYDEEYYYPIPLTEEILEKNGFRESIEEGVYYFPEQYQEVNNRGFAVETNGDGEWYITDHQLIKFCHVHKFQRILRDCEMNELADNFEI